MAKRRLKKIQQDSAAYNYEQGQAATNNYGELPKDPTFVRTWDTESYSPPVVDPPSESYAAAPELAAPPYDPDPQYRKATQSFEDLSAPQEPEPTPSERSYQSFADYSKQFQTEDDGSIYDPSRYLTAYDSQVKAANQGATVSTAAAERARQLALEEAKSQASDQTKQLEQSYDPKLSELKQFLSDRGILDSSVSGEKLTKLLTDQQDSIKRVQENLTKRTAAIDADFQERSAVIQQQTQQQIADQQDLLAQRLDALNKDKRVSEDAKKKFQYQIYQDYIGEIQNIQAQDQAAQAAEEKAKQQALENELAIANVTGIFQGNPTYKAQQDAFDNQLALDKFNKPKGSGGGSGSGGSSTTAPVVQSALGYYKQLRQQGFQHNDALGMASKKLTAAQARALNDVILEQATNPPSLTPESFFSAFNTGVPSNLGGMGLLGGLANVGKTFNSPEIYINPADLRTDQLPSIYNQNNQTDENEPDPLEALKRLAASLQ